MRLRIRDAVSWDAASASLGGCTAIIGMCHRLPDVLVGNLDCLNRGNWPELREVIVVVDAQEGALPRGLENAARERCSNLSIRFIYYSRHQAAKADAIGLPFVYSWLSWCIGLSACTTRVALLHDYDALVLDDSLAERYEQFVASDCRMQGIAWYKGNGIIEDDRLATTFEAFLDVAWVRSFRPIEMFNQVAVSEGRSRDYDTLLEMQHKHTSLSERAVVPMKPESLVHPTQMIHQYTMMRKYPGGQLPCYSIPMIPFFDWLSGIQEALATATQRLRERSSEKTVDFFGDGLLCNFSLLNTKHVDWSLKQMLTAALALNLNPGQQLIEYGNELYRISSTPRSQVWRGDFRQEQYEWIRQHLGKLEHSEAMETLARKAT